MVEKPGKNEKKVKVKTQSSEEKQPLLVLQELKKEEAALMEEKRDLATLKERLQLKTSEEIQVKEQSVQTLTSEVAELKRQCEEFESSL